MADFVKRKIVEKLARFTKDLKPSDISLSFLSGKGELTNLELDSQFITEVLQLPPWIRVSRVFCNRIKARVPFTSLSKEPVHFTIDRVEIDVATCVDEGPRQKHDDLLDKLGTPSKYGFTEKVIDGMRVEVHCIVVQFQDPTFHASLEITDLSIQSTTPHWKPDILPHTRHKIPDEDSVIIYKKCTWSSLKLEGCSTGVGVATTVGDSLPTQLRLLSGDSCVKVALKRLMSNCAILCTRVSVHLGDVIWILTQTQLRAVSKLVQSLMEAAVKTAQANRQKAMDDSRSSDSSEADFQDASKSKGQSSGGKGHGGSSRKKRAKPPTVKELAIKQRMEDYRNGTLNLPAYDIIQDSFHFRTGKIDLQLCDDTSDSEAVQGSMLVQLCQVNVDVYFDQPAGSGRHHWNKSNDLILKNHRWSKKKVERASKTQYLTLPSVSLSNLRERGVVIRCGNFSVQALKTGDERTRAGTKRGVPTLPVLTSDKKTFNIPDDFHNPAVQVGLTTYFYPDSCGNKFLVPRSNTYAYLSPIHVNVHQQSCLWLVEFAHGVVQTVNVDLAISVHDEGKTFLEARQSDIQQLPGFDAKFKVLFTKFTLPIPDEFNDGRPKALQVETAAIKAKNRTLDTLFNMAQFSSAIEAMKASWLFSSSSSSSSGSDREPSSFPNLSSDLPPFPGKLDTMLHSERRVGRRRGSTGASPQETQATPINPEGFDVVSTEGWILETSCVHIAFADSFTHEATLYTKTFVEDFPLNVWLFLPQDEEGAGQRDSPTPSQERKNKEPTISFIAHSPGVIRAELERLQLLFLMRLKDSFTAFKNTLVKFLQLPSPPPPPSTSTTTKQQQSHESHDPSSGSHDPSSRSHDPSSGSHDRPARSRTPEDGVNTGETPPQRKPPDEVSASIAGCLLVEAVQANIMLPSLYTDRPTKSTSTDDVTSPTTPLVANQSAAILDDVISQASAPFSIGSSQTSLTSAANTASPLLPLTTSSQSSLASSQTSHTSFRLSPSPLPSSSVSELPSRPARYASTSVLYSQPLPSNHQAPPPPLRSVSASNFSEIPPEGPMTMTKAATVEDAQHEESEVDNKDGKEDIERENCGSMEVRDDDGDIHREIASSKDEKEEIERGKTTSSSSGNFFDDFVMVGDTRKSSPQQQWQQLEEDSPTLDLNATPKASTEHLLSSPPSPSPRPSLTPSQASSSKRMKSPPPPLKEIPRYVLQIEVQGINALAGIEASDITIKASTQEIKLNEIESGDYQKKKTDSQFTRRPPTSSCDRLADEPLVKARIEVGDQVTRYYPGSPDIDNIVIATARDVNLVLQLPNMVVLKDFFDDECEPVTPLPFYLRVADSKLVLLEDIVTDGVDSWKSLVLRVSLTDVNRGKELISGADVFNKGVELVRGAGVACEGGEGGDDDRPVEEEEEGGVVNGEGVRAGDRYGELLEAFKTFMDSIDSHMRNHRHPPSLYVAGLLRELQSSLAAAPQANSTALEGPVNTLRHNTSVAITLEGSISPAPPSYSEAVFSGGGPKLRELERDKEELELKLIENKKDFFMVTEECKKAKHELVTYKQVMEKLQGEIEVLLSENFDLKRQLNPPPT